MSSNYRSVHILFMFFPLFFNSSCCIISSYFILYDRIMHHISYVLTNNSIYFSIGFFHFSYCIHATKRAAFDVTTDGAAAAIAKASVQRIAELQASAAAPKVTASEAKFSRKKARHRSSEGKEVLDLWRFSFWSCFFFLVASFFSEDSAQSRYKKEKGHVDVQTQTHNDKQKIATCHIIIPQHASKHTIQPMQPLLTMPLTALRLVKAKFPTANPSRNCSLRH